MQPKAHEPWLRSLSAVSLIPAFPTHTPTHPHPRVLPVSLPCPPVAGLVSAVLKGTSPGALGRETVQSLLGATFGMLEVRGL